MPSGFGAVGRTCSEEAMLRGTEACSEDALRVLSGCRIDAEPESVRRFEFVRRVVPVPVLLGPGVVLLGVPEVSVGVAVAVIGDVLGDVSVVLHEEAEASDGAMDDESLPV